MDERVVKFRVGVMVLATLIIAGILVLLFGDARSMVRGSYTVYMHFDDAPGVTEGTPVRKSGILIGRVAKVSFAEQGGVVVTAKIDGGVKLFRSEVPQVSGSLLGGDVVIQFVRRAKAPNGKPRPGADAAAGQGASTIPASVMTAAVAADPPPAGQKTAPSKTVPAETPNDLVRDGEYIEGTVAPNAFQVIGNLEGDLSEAINSLSTAGDEVAKLAGYFNKLLEGNDEQINRIVKKTESTIDSFQKMLANVEDLLGTPEIRDSLKQTIRDLPQLLADTRSAVTTIQTTVESVDRNMRNIEGLTGPLGEKGNQIVDRVDQAVTRLDELLGVLSDFGRKLNSGEGSLGQLMRSPELYQHLNSAAKNIDNLTRELKPILNDARVFTDKIARHPELLGVRGAIQKNSGTKYAPQD
ncbi:MAG: MCE family protein [Planctomycetia bacterium]|nr:MCE family protein [Planctomycetia bacterium]